MAWENRHKKRFYYRVTWADGRVRREYFGRGEAAKAAAAADSSRRATRAARKEECRQEQARLATASAPLLELCALTDLLSRAALLAAGFHLHARGEWRRKRGVRIRESEGPEGSEPGGDPADRGEG